MGFEIPYHEQILWVHHLIGMVHTRSAGAFPPGRIQSPSACPGTSYEVAGDDEHVLQAPACAPSSPSFGGPDWLAYLMGQEHSRRKHEQRDDLICSV